MALLVSRRRGYAKAGTPYDAEVEYLEANGTQYIDTGYGGDQNTKLEIKFIAKELGHAVTGSRNTNTDSINIYVSTSATQRFGNASKVYTFKINTEYAVIFDKTGIEVNGTKQSFNASNTFTTLTNIFVFGNNNEKLKCQVIYYKLYQNGTLVRDFIPVRVGQVGYLYDKVSGQLFGNAGTGSFTLGNDVTT